LTASDPEKSRDELKRLLRDSDLEPILVRQWLRVLPHLKPAERAKLHELLQARQLGSSPETTASTGAGRS